MPGQTIIQCDYANSITSFPLDTTAPISEALYDSVDEPITMNFQWATRSVAPRFLTAGLIDDGVGSGSGSANISTINFHNTTYTLDSVQIIKATHNNWILGTKSLNTEDILMTFKNITSSFATYIMVVIPIIRSGTTQPTYLQGLSTSGQSTTQLVGSFSISSCMPTNPNSLFAYYVTCLDGYVGHERPSNAYVFVAVQGLAVAPSLMMAMSKSIGPVPTLPFKSLFANKISIVDNTDFKQYVLSTRVLLDAGSVTAVSYEFDKRIDQTSAYQCVPIDPDRDISNNEIQVDLKSGKLLSDVMAERASLINDTAPVQTPAQAKNVAIFFETIMGLVCAVILFTLILYMVYSKSTKSSSAAGTPVPAAVPSTNLSDMPFVPYIAVGLVFMVAGIAIGTKLGF